MVYEKGDLRRFGAIFKDIAGTLTDPSTTSLIFTKPNGVQVTYTFAGGQITRNSVGNFHRDENLDQAGLWFYKWVGTGAVQEVQHGEFMVEGRA